MNDTQAIVLVIALGLAAGAFIGGLRAKMLGRDVGSGAFLGFLIAYLIVALTAFWLLLGEIG